MNKKEFDIEKEARKIVETARKETWVSEGKFRGDIWEHFISDLARRAFAAGFDKGVDNCRQVVVEHTYTSRLSETPYRLEEKFLGLKSPANEESDRSNAKEFPSGGTDK